MRLKICTDVVAYSEKLSVIFAKKTYQLLVITICSFGMTLLHTFLCTACCMYAKKCALLRRYEIGLSEKSISGLVFLFGLQNMAIFFLLAFIFIHIHMHLYTGKPSINVQNC